MCAVAAVLSLFESFLPELPVPDAKLGLSNLAVMTSLCTDGITGGLCTAAFKAFFALLTRGLTAGLMSFSGSILSTFVMWLVLKCDRRKFGCVGIGIIGAVVHNIGQLMIAFFVIGNTVRYYVPYLIIAAVFAGAFTGIVNSVLIIVVSSAENTDHR